MAIAMRPNGPYIRKRGKPLLHPLQQIFCQCQVVGLVFIRHKLLADQFDARMPKGCDIELGTMNEPARRADMMNTPEQSSHNQQIIEIVEFRRTSSLAGIEGKAVPFVIKQAFPRLIGERRHHRQLLLYQFKTKLMFFQNLLITPALRAIKLSDQRIPSSIPT